MSRGRAPSASDFVTSFKAEQVKNSTEIPLNGTCTYDVRRADDHCEAHRPDHGGPEARRIEPGLRAGPRIRLRVRPGAAAPRGAGSDLPNTGGPNRLFLAGGLLLLISGATAVTLARRRAEEAELRVSRA